MLVQAQFEGAIVVQFLMPDSSEIGAPLLREIRRESGHMDEAEAPPSDARLRTFHADASNWSGFMYFCKQDTRLFVPKRNPGFGWTLNFGHRFGCGVLLLFIAVWPGLISGLTVWSVTRVCEPKKQ